MTYADSMTSAPRRRDKAATRTALLDAARRRFAQHGYDGTGVRDIAHDAGVDPALVFRYFGAKDRLYAEAVRVEVPEGLTAGADQSAADAAEVLAREVVFGDWAQFDGEHPIIAMLRSSGRPDVRAQLREQICDGYLDEFAQRFRTADDAALRAEMVAALLLGMGVMRSVVGAPELARAGIGDVREHLNRVVSALDTGAAAGA